ncbi:MAG: right-handed parallel beta-helix repeat-containing protein, partial [Nitrospirae bacterium]|nr:right-handed parallel beta-helix repeat-containing protein [Nitrospirota bacterium]
MLYIGYSTYKGRLNAQGTAASPIVVTSNKATPAAGDWLGIRFYNHATSESSLDYVTVEYGGTGSNGEIYVSNSSPTINTSIIRYSPALGIYLVGDSALILLNSTLSNNGTGGVYMASTGGLTITGSTILSNGGYGVYCLTGTINILNNSFTNNGFYALSIPPNVTLGTGNTFSGNGKIGIALTEGVISTDTTWTLAGSPYIITGHIFVFSTTSEPTLTIEPGVVVKFD